MYLNVITAHNDFQLILFSDVCYLRLDFESFTTLGPSLSTETLAYACPDTFIVTVRTSIIIN